MATMADTVTDYDNGQLRLLLDFLESLHALGRDLPACLVSLTTVVQPQIPGEMRVPLLGKMFQTAPELLHKNSDKLDEMLRNPPENEVGFRLLLDLRQVQHILQSISYLQLLHLTNNTIPPGSPEQQLAFLDKLQKQFSQWTYDVLTRYNKILSETPLHLERQKLLQLETQLPMELLHLIIELLKLPMEELEPFKRWIEALPKNHLILMVNLLQMEPAVLIEIKRRITTPIPEHYDVQNAASLGTKRDRWGNTKSSDTINSSKTINNDIAQSRGMGIREPVTKKLHSATRQMEHDSRFYHQPETMEFVNDIPAPPLHLSSDMELFSDGNHAFGDPFKAAFTASSPPIMGIALEESHLPTTEPIITAQPIQQQRRSRRNRNNGDDNYRPEVQSMIMSSTPPNAETIPTALATSSPPPMPADREYEFFNPLDAPQQMQFQLRIAKQPPAKTVYQRILKPFPAIMLIVNNPAMVSPSSNLFVEATLLRSDSEVELPLCLDGNRIIRIAVGVFGMFKKLKILSTSQQQGTLFRLKFQLKKYVGNIFETIMGACVISNPIEVFSHTQYLTDRKNSPPPPPNVTEVLPQTGTPGGNTRVVVLGSNFHNSPKLRVRFGDKILTAHFHESGTLIVTTPPGKVGTTVKVRVSNDGKDFCETFGTFHYT